MDITSIALIALELLSPLVVAGLGWLGTQAAGWIRVNVGNAYLRGVLERLDDVVVSVVKEFEQTVVSGIKAARADGSLSEADKAHIKDTAVAQVKALLGAQGMALLGKVLGLGGASLDSYISTKVEAAVHDVRTLRSGIKATVDAVGTPTPLGPTGRWS